MGSQLPKVIWGHSCVSRIHILELEKPLWLVCIQCVPRMQVTELEKSLWLFCRTATRSSIHAWKIPWTEEPGGLQSMGSQSQTLLSDFCVCVSSPGPCWPLTGVGFRDQLASFSARLRPNFLPNK